MKKQEIKEKIVDDIQETTIDRDKLNDAINAKNILMAKSHCDRAFSLLSHGKKEEAKAEIEIAYNLDSNNARVYLAKLYIKFNIKNFEDLKKKASNSIVNSSFFKAAFELGDTKLKDDLNQIIEEVEYKELEVNLDNADVEQLLKHLRIQKSKDVDYTYTISLILGILYRSFRYIDTDYIDENLAKDNFIPILVKMESSFQYYMDILYHFDYISDIKDIIAQCIKDHKAVLSYLLIILKKIIDNTDDQEKLIEIKEFLETTYLNHEADDLLNAIYPKLKKETKFSKKALIIATASLAASLLCIFVGVGVGISVSNAPVLSDGVTYAKNNRGGYTIISYDRETSIVNFKDEVDGLPVNMIEPGVFYDSSVQQVNNFPKYISEIPASTFESCDFLTSFTFSDGSILSTIGDGAFRDCTSLETFNVPQFVTTIGNEAFANTPNLVNLTKESPIEFNEKALGLTPRVLTVEGTDITMEYYNWDVITLDVVDKFANDFTGYRINDNLEDFKPVNDDKEGVTFSCSGYYSITAEPVYLSALVVTDEYGVTYQTTEEREFYTITGYNPTPTYANRITLMYLINGIPVTQISPTAFQNNRTIEQINNFPHFIEEIPANCFSGCISLNSFIFSHSQSQLKTIEENAFNGCTSLTSFTLPSSVEYLGDNAFANTPNLTTFHNSYDFSNPDQDEPHYEAIRVGFTQRQYVITYEEGGGTSGIYYNCEDKLPIIMEPRKNYRGVFVDNSEINKNDPAVSKLEERRYLYDVQGKESLDLTLYYERYYDSSYKVSLDERRTGNIILNNESATFPLYSTFTDSRGETVEGEDFEFKYNVIQTSSQINATVDGSNLVVTKNESSSDRQQFIIIEVRVVGKYSEEVMVTSSQHFINVTVRN